MAGVLNRPGIKSPYPIVVSSVAASNRHHVMSDWHLDRRFGGQTFILFFDAALTVAHAVRRFAGCPPRASAYADSAFPINGLALRWPRSVPQCAPVSARRRKGQACEPKSRRGCTMRQEDLNRSAGWADGKSGASAQINGRKSQGFPTRTRGLHISRPRKGGSLAVRPIGARPPAPTRSQMPAAADRLSLNF